MLGSVRCIQILLAVPLWEIWGHLTSAYPVLNGAFWAEIVQANPLKDMLGPWGLEPQASTVSIMRSRR